MSMQRHGIAMQWMDCTKRNEMKTNLRSKRKHANVKRRTVNEGNKNNWINGLFNQRIGYLLNQRYLNGQLKDDVKVKSSQENRLTKSFHF